MKKTSKSKTLFIAPFKHYAYMYDGAEMKFQTFITRWKTISIFGPLAPTPLNFK